MARRGGAKAAAVNFGLARLKGLSSLERLDLWDTQATDAGLEHLAKLTRLKELWLHNTKITDDGYKRLRAALPHCTIQADVPSYWQSTQTLHW